MHSGTMGRRVEEEQAQRSWVDSWPFPPVSSFVPVREIPWLVPIACPECVEGFQRYASFQLFRSFRVRLDSTVTFQ
jgi:hypothetical protein